MDWDKQGGSAFPAEQHETQDGSWNTTFEPGMSLRDWFAGQALSGMCQGCGWQGGDFEKMASHAYEAADQMLARRDQDEL